MDDQKSKQQKNGQDEDKGVLKEYLNQYYTGRIMRSQLERRLKNIRAEMDAPIGGYGYSPVNYGGTNKVSPGAASFVYRMSEIETRIEDQKSTERMGLELRFIDCKNWEAIEKEMHLSRRACFDYQNRALEKILGYKKVETILKNYQKEKFRI